jgi:hypothetical protein
VQHGWEARHAVRCIAHARPGEQLPQRLGDSRSKHLLHQRLDAVVEVPIRRRARHAPTQDHGGCAKEAVHHRWLERRRIALPRGALAVAARARHATERVHRREHLPCGVRRPRPRSGRARRASARAPLEMCPRFEQQLGDDAARVRQRGQVPHKRDRFLQELVQDWRGVARGARGARGALGQGGLRGCPRGDRGEGLPLSRNLPLVFAGAVRAWRGRRRAAPRAEQARLRGECGDEREKAHELLAQARAREGAWVGQRAADGLQRLEPRRERQLRRAHDRPDRRLPLALLQRAPPRRLAAHSAQSPEQQQQRLRARLGRRRPRLAPRTTRSLPCAGGGGGGAPARDVAVEHHPRARSHVAQPHLHRPARVR